jgi:tetratricopeptide (TPR) repeat protein
MRATGIAETSLLCNAYAYRANGSMAMPTSIGGIGTGYVGERDKAPDGSYVTTEFFIVGIPLVPLGSYRVRSVGDLKTLLNTTRQDFEVTPVELNLRQVANVYFGYLLALIIIGTTIYGWTYYENKRNLDRAIAYNTEAITKNPYDSAPYKDRGQLYLEAGDYDRAIVDFTKALELQKADPYRTLPLLYLLRGGAYDSKRDYDLAIADFTRGIELEKTGIVYEGKSLYLYYERGASHEKKKDREKAIADYQRTFYYHLDYQPSKEALKRLGVVP